jgi:hypothetical protein
VDYRPKTNAVILLDLVRTLRGDHSQEGLRKGRKPFKNLHVVDLLLYRANIVILNWQRPLWEGDKEVMKKTGRGEPIWVIIHICMETTQEIFLYSYFHLKLSKC